MSTNLNPSTIPLLQSISGEHQLISDFRVPVVTSESDLSTCRFADLPTARNRRGPIVQVYCHLLSGPGVLFLPWAYAPVIFKVTGRISREDCYLTTRGDAEIDGGVSESAGKLLASCWLEAPSEMEGTTEWDAMFARLSDIAMSTSDANIHLREFLHWTRGEQLGRLQIIRGFSGATAVLIHGYCIFRRPELLSSQFLMQTDNTALHAH
ncbi:hypothetical protein PHLCEN_2v12524 [Hermanssonia centrifuga]|uniref:Uncharacterized protein n=1 Tax=Hermanssonia centrifuga TaxID=98765 RepID=A0A2R6NGT4_9APHY|nr:hypothetical protein PHLCEN_2v12524 [Hermanssonia centrifuga]